MLISKTFLLLRKKNNKIRIFFLIFRITYEIKTKIVNQRVVIDKNIKN